MGERVLVISDAVLALALTEENKTAVQALVDESAVKAVAEAEASKAGLTACASRIYAAIKDLDAARREEILALVEAEAEK